MTIESRVNVHQPPHADNQQAGSDKQHSRQTGFANDKSVSQPALSRGGAGVLCQFGMEIRAASSKRRSQSKSNACDHREKEREQQHWDIYVQSLKEWHALANSCRHTGDE